MNPDDNTYFFFGSVMTQLPCMLMAHYSFGMTLSQESPADVAIHEVVYARCNWQAHLQLLSAYHSILKRALCMATEKPVA